MTEAKTETISAEELAELRAIKDQYHALKNADKPPLCDHACEHGHKAILVDLKAREEARKEAERLDRADKEKRLVEEEARLDGLIRAGRINRDQKASIMKAERERMGL